MTGISEFLTDHATAIPDAVAVNEGDKSLTYSELDRRAWQVANGLIALGLVPGQRIAVLDQNSATYYELFFGAARAGVTLVPLNWRLAGEELLYIMNDAGAEPLFVTPEYRATLDGIRSRLVSLRTVIGLENGPDGYENWRNRQSTKVSDVFIEEGDALVQMYTSGTTGRPKGAVLTHGNILSALENSSPEMGPFSANDVLQVIMPQFHIAGTMWGLFGLFNGGRVEVIRTFTAETAIENVERRGVTHTFIVPAAINLILQSPRCEGADFSSLQRVYYGASPIPKDLLLDAMDTLGCDFVQLYGLTETCGVVTHLPPEDHDPDKPELLLSCGKPFSGIELRIVDSVGNSVPSNEVGEIALRGDRLFREYFGLSQATDEAYPDGWFRTGDAGYLNDDGYLFIHDRMKDMIVSGGENIYPAEVENAVFGHEAIAEVAVIGVPDPKWGETVKACVVLKPGVSVSADEIIAFTRTRIAAYKTPKSVDFLEALPRNASGKLLRKDLRAPYWEAGARRVN